MTTFNIVNLKLKVLKAVNLNIQIDGVESEFRRPCLFFSLILSSIVEKPFSSSTHAEFGSMRFLLSFISGVRPIHHASLVTRGGEYKLLQVIVVEIIDSGEGMDEETQKKLFTPFHTTKSKGSGLGLPISLKIVENHNGKIKITSEKGLGTTVQVFLPTHQK